VVQFSSAKLTDVSGDNTDSFFIAEARMDLSCHEDEDSAVLKQLLPDYAASSYSSLDAHRRDEFRPGDT